MVHPSAPPTPSPAQQFNCLIPFWFWFAVRRHWRNKNSPHNKLKETFRSRILPMQDETFAFAIRNCVRRRMCQTNFELSKGATNIVVDVCVSGCGPMNRLARPVTAADSSIDGPINLHTKRQVSVLNVNFACLMNSLSMHATRRGPGSNLTQLPVSSLSHNPCSKTNPPPPH